MGGFAAHVGIVIAAFTKARVCPRSGRSPFAHGARGHFVEGAVYVISFPMLAAPLSYRSPKTEVRPSPIHGHGLFAKDAIAQGEVVAVKGGHIISHAQLRAITPQLGPVEIQVGDDFFIAPLTADERDGSMLYSNHSCEPNLGLRGEITFVAMRDISENEELTHDWALTDDDDYSVECHCGAANCRGTLRGKDWQRRELQQRYAGYFSAYLAKKIEARAQR